MVAKTTYLERYLAGEEEPVWEVLQAQGDSVRVEPLHTDALAVARETMGRARYNIELLVSRLTTLGYRFGYDWWEEFDPDGYDALEVAEHPPIFAPPKPDVSRRIAELEALVGPVPLSLRAWYERIGAVNFVGVFPKQDATYLDGFTS
jgi:hypothetical protein